MKYYEITCVRGHCGSGKSTNYITFYYKGANSVEAILWAKRQPGVKHSRMPLGCFEISEAKYKEKIKVSAYKRAFARQVKRIKSAFILFRRTTSKAKK